MKLSRLNTAKSCGMNGNESWQQGSRFKYEYGITTASGERKWVLRWDKVYITMMVKLRLWKIVLDISDRKAIENALKYNNEHDRLTGLYNRDYLVSLAKGMSG